MKGKISSVLMGIINILTAIFAIQINQSADCIDYIYVLGLNLNMKLIIFITLIVPIVLNLIYIILKPNKLEYISNGLTAIAMVISAVISMNSIALQIENIFSLILAFFIIIVAIIYITISLQDKEYKKTRTGLNIILSIITIILVITIYFLRFIDIKYENFVKEIKKMSTNNDSEYIELYEVTKDQKHGYINKVGEEVIPCIYDEVLVKFDNINLTALKQNKKIVVLNNKNEKILEVDEKCREEFIEKLISKISIEYESSNKSYKENRYIILDQIGENTYEYNDKYNLYYNCYLNEEDDLPICECKLINRETGEEQLTINTNKLPFNNNQILIYKNYNIPFVTETERGFFTPDGLKYLINSNTMYVVHFDGSNILFKNDDYYIFNNLQEAYMNIYILDDIYIAQLEDKTYKILDRNLSVIEDKLVSIKICENAIIYSKNNETYGLMNKQGAHITEDVYSSIESRESYQNIFVQQITTIHQN